MQIRRGTEAAWLAAGNPTLMDGELGFVTDVGKTAFKIGTGGLRWDLLPYVNSTYPEFTPSADLNTALDQGRYPLSSAVTYTSTPTLTTEFVQGVANDGDSILTVTVPSSGIVIQQINTSLTAKQFLRARDNTTTWTAWKRVDTLAAADSLSITNLTLTGTLTLDDGAVGTPSLTFTGDTNTGIYSSGGDNLSVTTNGVQRVAVGNTLTTIATPLTVSGAVTATVSGSADALIVTGTGVSKLKATIISGLLQVDSTSAANKISLGNTRSTTVGLSEIYLNSSPYLKVMPTTAAAATDLVWTGTNAAGSATTTIQCNGVPTSPTDLTTKSYVDDSFNNLSLTRLVTDRTDIDGAKIVVGVIDTGLAVSLHNQISNLNYALTSIPVGGKQTFTFRRGTGSSSDGTANCVVSITIAAGSGDTFCVTEKVVSGSAFTTILNPTVLLASYNNPPSPSPTLYSTTTALLSNVYTSAQPPLGYAGFTIYRLS